MQLVLQKLMLFHPSYFLSQDQDPLGLIPEIIRKWQTKMKFPHKQLLLWSKLEIVRVYEVQPRKEVRKISRKLTPGNRRESTISSLAVKCLASAFVKVSWYISEPIKNSLEC